MITRHLLGKTTWVDLESPTTDELTSVLKEFSIDERVRDEMNSPTPYPLTVAFPGYVYMIMHFPVSGTDEGARSQEVDFIVGKQFVITTRYEVIDTIHTLHKVVEAEELIGTPSKANRTGELLERILRRLYAAVSDEIEQAGRKLERIETDIFAGKERQTVRTISELARVLLRFDTALARHEEPLTDFLAILGAPGLLGTTFDEHAARIEARRVHTVSLVASLRAVCQELRITNDSLLSSSQNQVMKTLTIMAFVTFPLTLISSMFGMNTEFLPIVGVPGDFWYIIAIMTTLAVGFFLFFRFKKWL